MGAKKEVTVTYSGEVYHDMNGVTYKHFTAEVPGISVDARLIILPTDLFPVRLEIGDVCSIRLEKF